MITVTRNIIIKALIQIAVQLISKRIIEGKRQSLRDFPVKVLF